MVETMLKRTDTFKNGAFGVHRLEVQDEHGALFLQPIWRERS